MNLLTPVSWLREYLKTDLAAKSIAKELSLCGPSVERIEKQGNDYIFDVEVTSNRPDAFSMFGIAREAYAILKNQNHKVELVEPQGLHLNLDPDIPKKLKLDVAIENSSLCPRFSAIIMENVKVAESPAFIKNRLQKSGVRPINNIVDITNYVMLETGQPMHAFDFDKIKGAKMHLRASTDGEKLRTLDGQLRKLPKGTIVIEDAEKLIDLAGIMGGENSQITRRTKRIVLFVQSYNPKVIRKTTQALAFRTDAAARFEKGVDAQTIPQVLSRSVFLTKKITGARIASEFVDIYPKKQSVPKVTLKLTKLNDYLGIDLEPAKAAKILETLGFTVSVQSGQLTAISPTWRASDVKEDVDIIEEIARVYGYHNLPSKLPEGEIQIAEESILKSAIKIKNSLKALGLTEVMSYSIISKSLLTLTETKEKDAVELANPLTEEWQFMRPTIVPSLIEIIAANQNLKSKIKIFEIAKTYLKEKVGLPAQDLKIALVASNSNFYEMKGIVENLFELIEREPKFQKFTGKNPLSDNSQFALIKSGDKVVGGIGILKQSIADSYGIHSDTFIAEVNLTLVFNQPAIVKSYHPIPKYPPVIEDISAIFDEKTTLAQITYEAKSASTLVSKAEVIDVFTGQNIPNGKKSVTIRIAYQKSTGTPTQEEVTREREKVSSDLESNLKAQIRK